ncbi:MAG TPA: hypothetical protein VNW15_11950 [Rhizomicrobium sp.]|nr:hypothetical protein [Rhizomicrobium sp.]
MAKEVHYEVFRRVGARGGWTLHDVRSDRDSAIEMANGLMKSEQATGVKVVKETYNDETGDYLTLKIFEEGHNQVKISVAQEDTPHALPCFKPEDLYSYHARATIRRLMPDFLARNKLTVTELIHRADMLEKLEATGTLYQHAIQKVAVAQAASSTTGVQQIVKSLNELVTQATQKVYRDQRKGLFPNPQAEQFAELAGTLASQGDGAYIFNAALANHLKDAKGWDDKVQLLLTVMESAPTEDEPRKLVLSSVDAILAEVMGGSAALHELMGHAENLSEALAHLVQLFLGRAPKDAKGGLSKLTQHFAADNLAEARTAVADRIVAEFRSTKRLVPDSVVEELKALRSLANKIVMGVGKYLSHEDLVAAFTLRSKRLVTQEILSAHIEGAQPDEKVERLLFVEENVIGAENKRQLASFVQPVVNSAPFENFFNNAKTPILGRLQRLAFLQNKVRRSNFIEENRQEICVKMDRLALGAATAAKLFENIEARPTNHVEKATTLLKLTLGGYFTEGAVSAKAREMILSYLATPGFLAGYFASQPKTEGGTDQAMAALMADLDKAGITAETGLKSIAA